MKRSQTIEVGAIMLAVSLTVAACGDVDDRTAGSSYYGTSATSQSFNYEEEKKLRVTCDKPEDFSLPECHDKRNALAAAAASNSQQRTSHSTVIMYPFFWGNTYGGYSARNYGPSGSGARSYSSARAAVTGQGLASTYKASTLAPSSIARLGSAGSTIGARAVNAGIARGGFGGTGRAVAMSSVGHAGSISGS